MPCAPLKKREQNRESRQRKHQFIADRVFAAVGPRGAQQQCACDDEDEVGPGRLDGCQICERAARK
jgi:hypothetical protein